MQTKLGAKQKVRQLRKQGLSYNEILQKISVSKSSISLWCRNITLTPAQQARLVKKQEENRQRLAKIGQMAMAIKRKKEIHKIKREARKEIRSPSAYELKLIGAMIYWAEGSKSCGTSISNSDPKLIKFMTLWLQKICGVPLQKIKARLNIHANQSDKKIKKYWSKITRIPLKNFGKSYIKPEGTGHRKNILHNGVIGIRIGSEDLRHKITAWIKVLYQYRL